MGILEAIAMAVVAGLSPSPHSLFLAFVSLKGQKTSPVLLGGVLADFLIIFCSGILVLNGKQLLGPSFSIVGLIFLALIAWKLFFPNVGKKSEARWATFSGTMLQGFGVQLFNPYPYMFWAGVFFPKIGPGQVSQSVATGLCFLVIVYSIKWAVYASLSKRMSQMVRLLLARGAFIVFLISYIAREFGNQ